MDRFGYEGGTYTSPIGIKYEQRALQPGTHLKPYHKYKVLKQIDVEKSTVAPWFGDPGLGIQYKLPMSLKDILSKGYIKEIK